MTVNKKAGGSAPGDSIDYRILTAISRLDPRDPLALPPLYETLDPDALDALVSKGGVSEISFSHAGYAVEIDGDGSVQVTPLDE